MCLYYFTPENSLEVGYGLLGATGTELPCLRMVVCHAANVCCAAAIPVAHACAVAWTRKAGLSHGLFQACQLDTAVAATADGLWCADIYTSCIGADELQLVLLSLPLCAYYALSKVGILLSLLMCAYYALCKAGKVFLPACFVLKDKSTLWQCCGTLLAMLCGLCVRQPAQLFMFVLWLLQSTLDSNFPSQPAQASASSIHIYCIHKYHMLCFVTADG